MSSMYPSFGGAPARPCARCGAPLTINETQCSRCGTYNPLPQQGQQFGSFQQGAQGGGPGPSGPLWGGQAPQGSQYQQSGNGAWSGNQDASASAWGSRGQAGGWQQNNAFGGQEQPQMPQQQNMFGSGFAGQNQSPFSNFQQNSNPPASNNSFGGNSFGGSNFQQSAERPSMNSFFQATQQNGYGGASPMTPNRPAWMKKPGDDDEEENGNGKKRPNANVILVIIILVVALVGGGSYGGYYLYKHRNTGATSTPTTNGPAVVTPSAAPLFSDTFKDNSNKWDTNAGAGGKITLAGDGKLVLEADTGPLIVPAIVPGGKTFGDLRVDVDAQLTSTDLNNGYGIYVRAASAQNDPLGLYYRFEVYGDGNFYIYKGYKDAGGKLGYQPLKNSLQASDAINHSGKVNHLTVIAKGQTFTFSVNGTVLATFTDPTYKSGEVALFVSMVKNATSSAQGSFQHLAIFSPQ